MAEPGVGELDTRFSSPGAVGMSWNDVEAELDRAEIFWVTTVRPDGRPHTTPLIAVWIDGALYFGTGPGERKERNLRENRHCSLTTGCNAFRDGTDVVVQGDAERILDKKTLGRVAQRIARKYRWQFEVAGDALQEVVGPEPEAESSGAPTLVFRVSPATVFVYRRSGSFSATRWRL
jgi:nitroimidazol reductase NimA-like FMN-containing flavoprotein (pyridoxamine 5'-phosphate oxidase superfamily)